MHLRNKSWRDKGAIAVAGAGTIYGIVRTLVVITVPTPYVDGRPRLIPWLQPPDLSLQNANAGAVVGVVLAVLLAVVVFGLCPLLLIRGYRKSFTGYAIGLSVVIGISFLFSALFLPVAGVFLLAAALAWLPFGMGGARSTTESTS